MCPIIAKINKILIDQCDIMWQSARDGLIISAHIMSDLSLLVILASVLCLSPKIINDSCEYTLAKLKIALFCN